MYNVWKIYRDCRINHLKLYTKPSLVLAMHTWYHMKFKVSFVFGYRKTVDISAIISIEITVTVIIISLSLQHQQ